MKKTEYFAYLDSNSNFAVEFAISKCKAKRDKFLGENQESIEDIESENMQITWCGAHNTQCCCLIAITYYEKKK